MIKKPAQSIKVFPFYFCNTCEIIEINTLINELTHVNLTKYLLSESSWFNNVDLLFNFIFNARLKWIAGVEKIYEWEELFRASNHWKFDGKIPISFEVWWPVLDLFIC